MCLKYFQGTKQAFVICWGQAAVVGEEGGGGRGEWRGGGGGVFVSGGPPWEVLWGVSTPEAGAAQKKE